MQAKQCKLGRARGGGSSRRLIEAGKPVLSPQGKKEERSQLFLEEWQVAQRQAAKASHSLAGLAQISAAQAASGTIRGGVARQEPELHL